MTDNFSTSKSLFALAAGTFGLGITEYVMMSILPDLASQFDVSITSAGHLISAYALGVCVGAPLIVLFARNMPLRRILLLLMAIFIAGNLAFALSPNYLLAVASRFMAGLPHGAYFGTGALVASRIAGQGRAASAVALMCMGMTVACLIGVPAGSWLASVLSWRVIFGFAALWGVVTLVMLRVWIPWLEGLPRTTARAQFKFMRNAAPWLLCGATLAGNAGVFSFYSYIAPLITEVSHLPETFMPMLMLLVGASMCVGTYSGGRLSDRHGAGLTAYRLQWLIFGALAAITLFSPVAWLNVVLICFAAFALFAVSPPMQLLLIRFSPGNQLMGGAMIQIAFNLGNAVGAYCGGLPIEAGWGVRFSATVGAVFAVAGIVMMAAFMRRYDRPNKNQGAHHPTRPLYTHLSSPYD